jgi:hypothetical protein
VNCTRCGLPIVLRSPGDSHPENGEGLIINEQLLVHPSGRIEVIESNAHHEVCPA